MAIDHANNLRDLASVEDVGGAPRSSLAKGLDLLRAVAECNERGVTASTAARLSGTHVATAHRLLQTLVDRRFLSVDPYTKRYTLGVRPFDIAAKGGQDIAFVEFRRRLRRAIALGRLDGMGIVCISVLAGEEALCIDVVPNGADISVSTLTVGSRRPLGVGAASLAMLAALPQRAREAIIEQEADRYLLYGRLDAATVSEACAGLGAHGYVVNEAVIIPGIAAIAVPVFGKAGLIGALSVTNTASRLAPPRRVEIHERLVEVVRRAELSTRPR